VVEKILLASDGPGAWTAAAAVADDIVDEAEVCGAQLVAMSCRPRSLLRYALTGSLSHAVIMRAGCPVMVAREPGFRL
jgi:nucleotide-binding universal stress UspA family protein